MAKHKTWRDRLAEIAENYPGKRKGLSLAAGTNETMLKNILEGTTPKLDNFLAICEAAHVDPMFVLYGDEPPKIQIDVTGVTSDTGQSETWIPANDLPKVTKIPFEIEFKGDDILAIEIRDDSMAPVYRRGDFVICRKEQGRHIDNLTGLDCAVLTDDGKGYLKILGRGSRPGRYSLKSYNVGRKDVENVQLAWAAPVIWIKRFTS